SPGAARRPLPLRGRGVLILFTSPALRVRVPPYEPDPRSACQHAAPHIRLHAPAQASFTDRAAAAVGAVVDRHRTQTGRTYSLTPGRSHRARGPRVRGHH